MRNATVLALLLHCAAALASSAEHAGAAPADQYPADVPQGVRLFDLHDPDLMDSWAAFLATTPMYNHEPLPPSLQERLTTVVGTYRSLTPVDRPAFFVATSIDLLSDRLLAGGVGEAPDVSPMRVCPVFASGSEASVSSLLAVASGLPAELFVNAPGQPELYRYLFLQTEFSHCRFLAKLWARNETRSQRTAYPQLARLSFDVGARSYTALLSNEEELRALLEAVGDVDAITLFGERTAGRSARDEGEVFSFIRLLSLLATSGKSGYAAIPVLSPLLSEGGYDVYGTETLRLADMLDLAFRVRAAFVEIVPFPIRDTDDLLDARLAVAQALASSLPANAADERVASLLEQFVTGSELLLAPTVAQEKMPLIGD